MTGTAEAPAIIESGLPSTILMDIEAQALVAAYAALSKHGLEFGRLCYNFRKRSEVVQGGTTFKDTLARLDIPKSTAYFWIARYEEKYLGRVKPAKPITPELPEESEPNAPVMDEPTPAPSVEVNPFAEALALPDVVPSPTLFEPKQEYAKFERGIDMLKKLAAEVSAQYAGECVVKGTSGADNLPVTTGRYNLTLNLKGITRGRLTNALKALKGVKGDE
jgi:transposase-like protein